MSGKSYKTDAGKEVFIPTWPVDVAFENLTRACQYLGIDPVVNIANQNIPAVILAIANSKEPEQAANLVKHFVCSARIEGDKISPNYYDANFAGRLAEVAELFAMVCNCQFHDFFESGLAKAHSPSK